MPPAPTLAENVIRLADLRAAMAARAEALVGIIEAARAEALVGIIEAARAEEGGPLEPPDAG